MKNATSRCLVITALLLLAGALKAFGAMSGPNELAVGVRSGVDLAVKSRKERTATLGDLTNKRARYIFLWVKQMPSAEKLVQPVDARAIAVKLMQLLDAQGFQRTPLGEKPEIVVAAKYGRGYLFPNPYIHTVRGTPSFVDNLTDSGKLVPRPPFFEPLTGLEDKAHRAALEKLMIQVVAWKYPPPPNLKEEPEALWRATMTVDDPDHRDLNVVAAKMLEAGAPYFDRELSEPEITISKPLPEGRVKLGELKVVEEPKPAPK